jgi:hypothetical protein
MFGIRLSSLFRSRWMALGWAILVCLNAVLFASGRESGAGAQESQALEEAAAAIP